MSDGIVARLRGRLEAGTDLGAVLAGSWSGLGASELARRPVLLPGGASASFGDLFEVGGAPSGSIRFQGDLTAANRLALGLSEGDVVVEGSVGDDVGVGLSGGSLDIHGSAGARAGGAAADARRGMTGGIVVIRGGAGVEAGLRMRRGLIAITGDAAGSAGPSMIAGTVMIFGKTGPAPGRWSKRGSIVALGDVEVPPTYRYACTYQPEHLRLTLLQLRRRYELTVDPRHISGFYRRYSGDLAELGRGEILAWTAA